MLQHMRLHSLIWELSLHKYAYVGYMVFVCACATEFSVLSVLFLHILCLPCVDPALLDGHHAPSHHRSEIDSNHSCALMWDCADAHHRTCKLCRTCPHQTVLWPVEDKEITMSRHTTTHTHTHTHTHTFITPYVPLSLHYAHIHIPSPPLPPTNHGVLGSDEESRAHGTLLICDHNFGCTRTEWDDQTAPGG